MMCQIKLMLYSQEIQHTMKYKNTLKYVMYFMSDMNWFGAMETDTDHKGTSQDVVLVSGILAHLQLALLFNEIVTSPIISSLPLH